MPSLAARYRGEHQFKVLFLQCQIHRLGASEPTPADRDTSSRGLHGIVSIAGGDWMLDHPVPIFNSDDRSSDVVK